MSGARQFAQPHKTKIGGLPVTKTRRGWDYHPHNRHEGSVRPSVILERQRAAVRAVTSRYGVANPRVFGSVLRGTDLDGSDIDLLVDALPGTTLFDLT